MARSTNIYLVTINTRPLRAFTVKHECQRYLEEIWPNCPETLRVLRLRDGFRRPQDTPKDITAALYGLEE